MSSRDAARGLTASAFARLLARLGPDAERAGAGYETLRQGLQSFFTWRGAATPEECVDITLDRLAARLEEGLPVQDLARFAHGIARLVLLEHWRSPRAREAPLEEEGPAPPAGGTEAPDDEEALHACLGRCLAELPPDGRDLILKYYVAEGRNRIEGRKRIAEGLGLSEAALRNRARRLRDRLEECITRCLGRPPGGAYDTEA
jgi:DNA-directed RNA polymerase specialized sigma24 family protein